MGTPHLSDAEWKVMNAVWADAPTTARRVLDALEADTGWKYSTVKTMLERLVDKGALRTRMDGITSVYTPTLTLEDARRTALHDLADKAFGGMDSLAHFFVVDEKLSSKERRRLAELLRAAPRRRKRS